MKSPGETDVQDADTPDHGADMTSAPPAEVLPPEALDAGEHHSAVDGKDSADDAGGDAAIIPIAAGPPPELARVTFAELGLSDDLLRAIEELGYRHPTPIQEQAIPFVLMGRDVMGVAQTGTGKTAGFTLPMLDILTGRRARARMPRSLILEPTRELALQVAENFQQYGKYLKLTHALIIGGESMSDQKDVLMRGVDVLIATPGRLLDMFERGSILLSDAGLLVIDEADRMLDMGFIPDVERIVSLLPTNRQTLFFSATMGPEIRRLADAFLRNPKEVTVSRSATVATTITEGLALVAEHDKREALRRMIRNENVQNALIFCNRKVDVDILFKSLSKHRFSAGALHGDMAQTIRFSTLEKFKAGELKLLVCSDVAARGLDIGGLSHVFNFDVPIHAEDYVHRIGRTGRAGLEGHAFTIASPDDRYAVEAIEKLISHPIPPMLVEGLDPVDWAEHDGRKRRGRKRAEPKRGESRKSPEKDKAEKDKAVIAKPDREKPARTERAKSEKDKPREPRARRERTKDERPRPERAAALEPVTLDVPSMARSSERPPRRDDARRDDPRRERYRRDDDLGPEVVGFGDDVPAFMTLRGRRAQAPESQLSENSEA
jgi:superfamily II DNA/RNA helicase